MKIVYITDAFAIWGGIEKVLADKMNAFAVQFRYEIILLTINQGNHPLTYDLHSNVKHVDLNVRLHQQYNYCGVERLIKRLELQKTLKKRMKIVLEEIRPDVIVCVKLDYVGVLMKIKENIPLVVESHTLCNAEKMDEAGFLRRIYVWSLKRCIRKADAIVALTKGDAADWKQYNKRVFVIPNVVHLNDSGSYASCEQKSVIYVGRFSKQKGIVSLLRIWKIVNQQHPDWRLDIYGEGEMKEYYLPIVSEMNANIRIYPPTSNILSIYRKHSILLLTSHYEPFGLVLPEAMSCGLPVVAFNCPYGPAEIITDGFDGYIVKNHNHEDFANHVCKLIEDENLRVKMGKVGIQSSQRYRTENIIPKWKNLFKMIVGDSI